MRALCPPEALEKLQNPLNISVKVLRESDLAFLYSDYQKLLRN